MNVRIWINIRKTARNYKKMTVHFLYITDEITPK